MASGDGAAGRNRRVAIYPGSFDPVTRGHLDIIARAAAMVDRLVVGVAATGAKDTLFTADERVAMIEDEVADLRLKGGRLRDVEVNVKPFSTLLVRFARLEKAGVIVRGLRAVSDFEYELQMAAANARLDAGVEIIFLMAAERLQFLSSRLVREIALLDGDVSDFVTPRVAGRLQRRLRAAAQS